MNETNSDRKLQLVEDIKPFQGMFPFGPIVSDGQRHNVIYIFPLFLISFLIVVGLSDYQNAGQLSPRFIGGSVVSLFLILVLTNIFQVPRFRYVIINGENLQVNYFNFPTINVRHEDIVGWNAWSQTGIYLTYKSSGRYKLCRLDLGSEEKRVTLMKVYEKAGVTRYSSLPTHLVGFRELLKWGV